jgi:hypothetical protein
MYRCGQYAGEWVVGDGRDGKPNAAQRVSGVVSQQLRYLEILFRDPAIVQ